MFVKLSFFAIFCLIIVMVPIGIVIVCGLGFQEIVKDLPTINDLLSQEKILGEHALERNPIYFFSETKDGFIKFKFKSPHPDKLSDEMEVPEQLVQFVRDDSKEDPTIEFRFRNIKYNWINTKVCWQKRDDTSVYCDFYKRQNGFLDLKEFVGTKIRISKASLEKEILIDGINFD